MGSQPTAQERYQALRSARPHLRLFALVDGLEYKRLHGAPLEAGPGLTALFEGTPDAALAPAGPWLADTDQEQKLSKQLVETETKAPCVSWLLAEMPLHGLAQLLQLKLDVRLPDGSTALLRFYDPRVLESLALTLTPQQREEFFGHILEWHFMCDGKRHRIGRPDA